MYNLEVDKISEENNIKEKVKRTRNRPDKRTRYEEERKEFIKNLDEKIGIDDKKRSILLYDLNHNNELKEYLKDQIPIIKKLYKYGSWNYFIQPEDNRDEIGLLKSIYKDDNYELISKNITAEREGVKKPYCHIFFTKDLKFKFFK